MFNPRHPEHVILPIPPKPTNVPYPMIPGIVLGHKVKPLIALFRLTAVKRHVCRSTRQLWDDTGVALLLKGLRSLLGLVLKFDLRMRVLRGCRQINGCSQKKV